MKYTHTNNNSFFTGLKENVNNYFIEAGQSIYGNIELLIKGVAIIIMYITANAAIYMLHDNYAAYAICYIIMGFSGVMIVFNIVHDASHNALFRNRKYNKMISYIGDLVGINTYIWDIRHNVQHHSFTNILGGDLIIEHIPLIRLSPHQPYHKYHRYQVFYAPVLYMLYSFYWIFVIDFKLFFKKEICNLKNIQHPSAEWIKLIFFKSVYIFYSLIAPALFTPLTFLQCLGFFFLMHIAAGLLLSGVALLGHFVEGPSFPEADKNGHIDNSWSEHQIEATIDFAPDSKIINWVTGGLNTHVAHHLFPKMCHIHYFKVTPIIKEYCLKNHYEYNKESLLSALTSHMSYLKKLSIPQL